MKIQLKKLNQVGMLSMHVLLPVIIAVVAIGSIGAYVLSTSSAAGWSYVGEATNYQKTVAFNVYACKNGPVTKLGYRVKTKAIVSKAAASQPTNHTYFAETQILKSGYFIDGNKLSSPLAVSRVSETGYIGYGNLTDTVRINPIDNGGTMGITGTTGLKYVTIGSLSTCP
jgi:uncharacterized protein (UPF0333 family)